MRALMESNRENPPQPSNPPQAVLLLLFALCFSALPPAANVGTETSARPVRKRNAQRVHRRRFDRDAAFERFVAEPGIHWSALGREFGVSGNTISKWAVRENWVARAEELRRKAAEKNALRTLEQQARQNARILV